MLCHCGFYSPSPCQWCWPRLCKQERQTHAWKRSLALWWWITDTSIFHTGDEALFSTKDALWFLCRLLIACQQLSMSHYLYSGHQYNLAVTSQLLCLWKHFSLHISNACATTPAPAFPSGTFSQLMTGEIFSTCTILVPRSIHAPPTNQDSILLACRVEGEPVPNPILMLVFSDRS